MGLKATGHHDDSQDGQLNPQHHFFNHQLSAYSTPALTAFSPGSAYHLMACGDRRENIFRDEGERKS